MKIKACDRVTVAGIPGTHLVTEVQEGSVMTAHTFLNLTLGCAYGRKVAGESMLVEAWRCSPVPVDIEDFPCSPA